MLENLSARQQELLKLLLENKAGLTVEELSQALHITRNAVRQHLAGLERDGLVVQVGTRPTGGRPELLYLLGDRGQELFPRRYSWFCQLLIETIRQEVGNEGLAQRLQAMGTGVAGQLATQASPGGSAAVRIRQLANSMTDLGYGAHAVEGPDEVPAIEANNCVFHHLAADYPEVCQFDLALMGTFVGAEVEHQECMVRGGRVCRFRFKPKN